LQNTQSLFDSNRGIAIIIKMDPSETEVSADLILTASSELEKTSGNVL
jgi:hypothetical protein